MYNKDDAQSKVSALPAAGKVAESHVNVDICVFAHNEAQRISGAIGDLAEQTALRDPRFSISVQVLANGCTDQTVAMAHSTVATLPDDLQARFTVLDLRLGDKSRTWNAFVHHHSRTDADILVMMDGDIRIPDHRTLGALIDGLTSRQDLRIFTSRPVKDLELVKERLSFVESAILAGSGGLADWRKSLCGQLYAIRCASARTVWLPIGLPVEDGFLRAMVVTDFLSDLEHEHERIDGDQAVWHVYESIRSVRELVHHQVRIVIGGAVNTTLFKLIRREAPTAEQAAQLFRSAALDDRWLEHTLKRELPRAPFGYVPVHYLVKRLSRFFQRSKRPSARDVIVLALGLGLDTLVYLVAQVRMARGRAAGFW